MDGEPITSMRAEGVGARVDSRAARLGDATQRFALQDETRSDVLGAIPAKKYVALHKLPSFSECWIASSVTGLLSFLSRRSRARGPFRYEGKLFRHFPEVESEIAIQTASANAAGYFATT